MSNKPFAIEKLAWYLGKDSNHDPKIKLKTLTVFLQENNLLTRRLIDPSHELDANFELSSSDVTEDGMIFLKKGYQKWIKWVDRGGDPTDSALLKRELKPASHKESREDL